MNESNEKVLSDEEKRAAWQALMWAAEVLERLQTPHDNKMCASMLRGLADGRYSE
jgi:hypothetical protein